MTRKGAVPAAIPANEKQRLESLRSYHILDTLAEQAYDDLVLIASTICQTPIALLSLVDEHRQFIKANVGLPVKETSRDVAFCAHAILDTKPMIVEDAHKDARFVHNPLVTGDPHIRFYAGVPLVNGEGHALGTICAIDRVPRELTDQQRRALEALSRQVLAQLELRRAVDELKKEVALPAPKARDASDPAERARTLLAQSDEMRSRIQTLLGRMDTTNKGGR